MNDTTIHDINLEKEQAEARRREKQRQYNRKHYWRVQSDPELKKKRNEASYAYYLKNKTRLDALHKARLEQRAMDERSVAYRRAQTRKYNQAFYRKLRNDPVRYEKYLADRRADYKAKRDEKRRNEANSKEVTP